MDFIFIGGNTIIYGAYDGNTSLVFFDFLSRPKKYSFTSFSKLDSAATLELVSRVDNTLIHTQTDLESFLTNWPCTP